MPTLAGKTVLITGANTGIGRVTALELGRMGAELLLAGRSRERTQPVLDELQTLDVRADFFELNLSSLASVRACGEKVNAAGKPLHLLINNAGLAGVRGTTDDGFELHFGVNHLGHFLFTELLLPRLKEAAQASSEPSRVVIVASRAHTRLKETVDFQKLTESTVTTTGFPEYCVSKLCNVLHGRELARRVEGDGIHTYSLHPGVVASDVWRRVPWPVRAVMKLFMVSNEEGAKTSIYCASEPSLANETGHYYSDSARTDPAPFAQDDAVAQELYDRSMKWAGLSQGS